MENPSSKSIGLWVGAALLITVVVVGVVKLADSGTPPGDGVSTTLPPLSLSDWVHGSATSSVVLIEYSDFECPACGSYFPIVEALVADYGSDLTFVYRHFPLQQHAYAKRAAYAAEAAGKQGKFWDMYRKVFEGQDDWAGKSDAEETFERYATELALNMEQFRTDVKSGQIADKVDADYRGGIEARVNATPTFFLNGRKLQNPTSLDAFKVLIDAALASSTPA